MISARTTPVASRPFRAVIVTDMVDFTVKTKAVTGGVLRFTIGMGEHTRHGSEAASTPAQNCRGFTTARDKGILFVYRGIIDNYVFHGLKIVFNTGRIITPAIKSGIIISTAGHLLRREPCLLSFEGAQWHEEFTLRHHSCPKHFLKEV